MNVVIHGTDVKSDLQLSYNPIPIETLIENEVLIPHRRMTKSLRSFGENEVRSVIIPKHMLLDADIIVEM